MNSRSYRLHQRGRGVGRLGGWEVRGSPRLMQRPHHRPYLEQCRGHSAPISREGAFSRRGPGARPGRGCRTCLPSPSPRNAGLPYRTFHFWSPSRYLLPLDPGWVAPLSPCPFRRWEGCALRSLPMAFCLCACLLPLTVFARSYQIWA